jgi:hypothetical protein
MYKKIIQEAKELANEGDEQYINSIVEDIEVAVKFDDKIALLNCELTLLHFINQKLIIEHS